MDNEKLKAIFESDELGLLDVPDSVPQKATVKRSVSVDRFDEIVTFFEKEGRLPGKNSPSIMEKRLALRLENMRKDAALKELLHGYDVHNLLTTTENRDEKAIKNIEDIFESDDMGLLGDDPEIDALYCLRNVPASEHIEPEFVARRNVCQNFEENYKKLFEAIANDINCHRRYLVDFKPELLEVGHFYVLRGLLLYLAEDSSQETDFDFRTGKKTRRDGRTRCILANGTEIPLLYRSLVKALQKDGFAVSELQEEDTVQMVDEDDVQNGFIYVLKSNSTNPQIQAIPNLYKIGFTSGDVYDRIKNAENEPTYLMSGVTVVMTARCFNLNTHNLENGLHRFFGNCNASFTIEDANGKKHYPREWFIAPLDIIEQAIRLVIEDKINDYRYDPVVKTIVALS